VPNVVKTLTTVFYKLFQFRGFFYDSDILMIHLHEYLTKITLLIFLSSSKIISSVSIYSSKCTL